MIHVKPYSLWLGHAGDCRDTAKVLDAGIRAVMQLAMEEPPVYFPRETICLRIPLLDGSGNAADDLRLAVSTIEQLLLSKTPTLVCCGAGMSRSPALAACALARVTGKTPAESLQWIHTQHGTDVSVTLWQDLLECQSAPAW